MWHLFNFEWFTWVFLKLMNFFKIPHVSNMVKNWRELENFNERTSFPINFFMNSYFSSGLRGAFARSCISILLLIKQDFLVLKSTLSKSSAIPMYPYRICSSTFSPSIPASQLSPLLPLLDVSLSKSSLPRLFSAKYLWSLSVSPRPVKVPKNFMIITLLSAGLPRPTLILPLIKPFPAITRQTIKMQYMAQIDSLLHNSHYSQTSWTHSNTAYHEHKQIKQNNLCPYFN